MVIKKTQKVTSNKKNKEKKIVVKCGGEYGGSFNDC